MINSYFGWMPSKLRNLFSDYLFLLPISKKGLNQDKIQKISRSIIFSDNPSLIYQSIKSLEKPNINKEDLKNYYLENKDKLPNCRSL